MQYSKRLYILFLVFASALFASCQKNISLKLSNSSPQLVIEANLTNLKGVQYVLISQSVPISSTDNFPLVNGAQVTLTDNKGHTYKFRQDTSGVYAYYPLAGVPGTTYTLTIITGGQTYTAVSTMPQLVNLDSLTSLHGVLSSNDLHTVVVNYQDPANVANQYLFMLYLNSKTVGAIFAFDDSFTNGRYVKQEFIQNSSDIHYNDTVNVEMQCIDKNVYDYWYSLSQQQAQGPGGGTTPSNPPSNFNNNALGYFSAHTTQTKAIIIK